MKLVENWRTWHKRWSVWLGTVGTTITSIMVLAPDAAQTAWNKLPIELHNAIPAKYVTAIGIGIFVLSMLAQLLKQKNLAEPPTSDA